MSEHFAPTGLSDNRWPRKLQTSRSYGANRRPRPLKRLLNLTPRAPQVQPAAVGERVGVALALLAVVLTVLVARAVAALAALVRERAPARDRVVLVQMAAVPANPIVHAALTSVLPCRPTPGRSGRAFDVPSGKD